MPNKNNKIDPRVIRSQALIREAFLKLLLEKPYEAISIQDIAHHATINRGTFYLHYACKEELLNAIIGDIFNDLSHSLMNIHATENVFEEIRLLELFEVIFNHVLKHAGIYKFMLVTQDIAQFRPKLQQTLKELIFHDPPIKFRIDQDQVIPGDLLVHYEASALVGVITWWLENHMEYTTQYMAAKMTHLALVGPFNTSTPEGFARKKHT